MEHNTMGSTTPQNQNSLYGDIIFWFPQGKKRYIKKFKKWWFGSYKIQYCLPNNIILLVNIDKFEPNPILVNINKLKIYQCLDQVPKGLEAMIEKGGEHKEDLQEDFQDPSIENQI